MAYIKRYMNLIEMIQDDLNNILYIIIYIVIVVCIRVLSSDGGRVNLSETSKALILCNWTICNKLDKTHSNISYVVK